MRVCGHAEAKLTASGAELLADALKVNRCLKQLNLCSTCRGRVGDGFGRRFSRAGVAWGLAEISGGESGIINLRGRTHTYIHTDSHTQAPS